MYSQAVTEQAKHLNKSNAQSSVIYLFPDNVNAQWFADSTQSLGDRVGVLIHNKCVIASAYAEELNRFMLSVERLLNDHNNRLIKSQQPGWIVHYNSHRNFGCLGIKRYENLNSNDVEKACNDMSSNQFNQVSNVAFEQVIDDNHIAKRLSHTISESEHGDKLSEGLILGWLSDVNALTNASSLLSPRYITEKFIEPITIANNLSGIKPLKTSIENHVASQQYIRYISTDDAITHFVAQVERCCMTSECESYTIGFLLATHFIELKTKQIKQNLIRSFCELCDTGAVSKSDIKQVLEKHLHFKTSQ